VFACKRSSTPPGTCCCEAKKPNGTGAFFSWSLGLLAGGGFRWPFPSQFIFKPIIGKQTRIDKLGADTARVVASDFANTGFASKKNGDALEATSIGSVTHSSVLASISCSCAQKRQLEALSAQVAASMLFNNNKVVDRDSLSIKESRPLYF
jgi:hypothetical protein